MHTIRHIPATVRPAFDSLITYLKARVYEQCASRDADLFLIRLERYFVDFYEPLVHLYGTRHNFQQCLENLVDLMLQAYTVRSEALRLLDLERHMTPDWFQSESMIGYVCYADLFAGNLQGIRSHLDYLSELGITYLHLMPVLDPRPGNNDGGYAVRNYRAINPLLGTMDDLTSLAQELHARGMSLCIDLVLNHTSSDHEWARRAMAGEQHYLDYYYTFDDRTLPNAYEHTLREVFPDFAPGNFTWFPQMAGSGRWVWTTFNTFQWDLNYHNPAVFCEMSDIMLFLANQGVDILRLDAIPFIWKNLGTDCENQPEVHLLVQAFRAVVRVVAPGVIFKAEAIVPPEKLVPYLGVGTAVGKECELAYHNQLMVLLWSTLASRNVTLMTQVLHQMPPTPPAASWLTYIRNHDDIGWAITDEHAAAMGENGFLHRQFLNAFYSGAFPGSFAKGSLFQYNPATQDARISGSTASLAGLERALETGDLYEIGLAVRRILLLHSIIMAFGGIPLIYMGDELGLLNDYSFTANAAKASDNRWLHRPVMNWARSSQRNDPQHVTGRIYTGLRQLIKARLDTPAIHSGALTQPMWTHNSQVFALVRKHPRGNLLLLANFDAHGQRVDKEMIRYAGLSYKVRNVLDPDNRQPLVINGYLSLSPYESMWLVEG